jgi:hypothetical protein
VLQHPAAPPRAYFTAQQTVFLPRDEEASLGQTGQSRATLNSSEQVDAILGERYADSVTQRVFLEDHLLQYPFAPRGKR